MSRPDLDDVCRLARLELTEREHEELGAQMERIVTHVRALERVDVEGVPPTKHVLDRTDVDRADAPGSSMDRERVLDQAPEHDEGHFVVPAVLPE